MLRLIIYCRDHESHSPTSPWHFYLTSMVRVTWFCMLLTVLGETDAYSESVGDLPDIVSDQKQKLDDADVEIKPKKKKKRRKWVSVSYVILFYNHYFWLRLKANIEIDRIVLSWYVMIHGVWQVAHLLRCCYQRAWLEIADVIFHVMIYLLLLLQGAIHLYC